MHRPSSENVAAERARWMDDLAAAIDDAQRVAWRIGIVEGTGGEAMALYGRLEIARAELDAIRMSGWATMREEFPPEWIDYLHNGTIEPLAGG